MYFIKKCLKPSISMGPCSNPKGEPNATHLIPEDGATEKSSRPSHVRTLNGTDLRG